MIALVLSCTACEQREHTSFVLVEDPRSKPDEVKAKRQPSGNYRVYIKIDQDCTLVQDYSKEEVALLGGPVYMIYRIQEEGINIVPKIE